MNKNFENINTWMGRIFMIALFFIVFSAFTGNNCKNQNPDNQKVAFEYVSSTNNIATEVTFPSLPDFNNGLFTNDCGFLNSQNENRFLILSNNININLLVKICTSRFLNIKRSILKLLPYLIHFSVTGKDYTSIS